MNGKIIIATLALVIVGAAAFLLMRSGSDPAQTPEDEVGQVEQGAPTARPAGPVARDAERPAAANTEAAPAADENLTRQRIEMLSAALKFASERKDDSAPGAAAGGSPAAGQGAGLATDQPGAGNAANGSVAPAPGAAGQGYRGPLPTGVAGAAPNFRNPQAPTQAEMAEATAHLENTDRELAMLMGKFMGSPEKMQQMTTYFDQLSSDNPNMSKAEILEALKNAPFNQ